MFDGWHVLEPRSRFINNWHIDAVCKHLTAMANGEIRNLIILMPPRCEKSLLCAVFFPMWLWAERNPSARFIYASYAERLAVRDGDKCRRLIQSPWFQRNYGHKFALAADQNTKHKFENDKTGCRISVGVGGVVTGEGADYACVDDAHKALESESQAARERVKLFWNETLSTRGNNPATFCKLIVGQRVHERDLAQDQIERNLGYEVLSLPMEYEIEEAKRATSLGFVDPRTDEGELLWEKRFPRAEVEALKRQLGAYGTAAQLQQRPAPREGGMFKRSWFEIVDALPETNMRWVRYWDKAFTEGGGAFTAGGLMGMCDVDKTDNYGNPYIAHVFYLADVVRGQWEPGARDEVILRTAHEDRASGRRVKIFIEQEPGPMGRDANRALIAKLAGFDVGSDVARANKALRAEPLAAQCSVGSVKLLRGAWNEPYLAEMAMFPHGAYKDQADMTSGAFNRLLKLGGTKEFTAAQLRMAFG